MALDTTLQYLTKVSSTSFMLELGSILSRSSKWSWSRWWSMASNDMRGLACTLFISSLEDMVKGLRLVKRHALCHFWMLLFLVEVVVWWWRWWLSWATIPEPPPMLDDVLDLSCFFISDFVWWWLSWWLTSLCWCLKCSELAAACCTASFREAWRKTARFCPTCFWEVDVLDEVTDVEDVDDMESSLWLLPRLPTPAPLSVLRVVFRSTEDFFVVELFTRVEVVTAAASDGGELEDKVDVESPRTG